MGSTPRHTEKDLLTFRGSKIRIWIRMAKSQRKEREINRGKKKKPEKEKLGNRIGNQFRGENDFQSLYHSGGIPFQKQKV